jgi:aspartyl-tRNA(Asn)/glutamyl-tRNA(Gln) amidotransferase subunit C
MEQCHKLLGRPMPEPVETPPPPAGEHAELITREEVRHLADLARIDLDDAELDHLAPQLSVILESVASIREVAADDIAPTSHPLPIVNVFREDVVRPSLSAAQALSGAPLVEDQRFAVPRILGDEQ